MFARWRIERIATRYQLGPVIAVFRTTFLPYTVIVFAPLAIFGAFVSWFQTPNEPMNTRVFGVLLMLLGGALLSFAGYTDRMIITQRGLIIGCFLPGLKQFVLPWHTIDLTTMRYLKSFHRIRHAIKVPGASARRAEPTQGTVFSFAGPASYLVKTSRTPTIPATPTRDQREIWFFPVRGHEQQVRDALAYALGPQFGTQVRAQLAQPIKLTGTDRQSITNQIPGFQTQDYQR